MSGSAEVPVRVQFVIPGRPVGKERPRVVRHGSRTITYTPMKSAGYERLVGELARMRCRAPLEGPVKVSIVIEVAVPVSWPRAKREERLAARWAEGRPDVDNVVKSILDGMNGVVFRDDSQVVAVSAERIWGRENAVRVDVEAVG